VATAHVRVIVLNWNGWQQTAECLRSLQNLRYERHSVVVVDNGSTDESVEQLRKLFPGQEILLNQANLGFAGGNNPAIRQALAAGSDYVWLLNNDTVVDPEALTAMVELAEATPQTGAVASAIYRHDSPEEVEVWGGGKVNFLLGVVRHHLRPVAEKNLHYLSGASLLLRRRALEKVGLLDDGFFLYWEDTDLGFRLRKAGWKLAVASRARVWHRGNASLGVRNPRLDYYFNRSALRFFHKHAPVPAIPILVSVVVRLLLRAVHGEWSRLAATWQAIRVGQATGG
jgi:GT2 family glycosyltransferase